MNENETKTVKHLVYCVRSLVYTGVENDTALPWGPALGVGRAHAGCSGTPHGVQIRL